MADAYTILKYHKDYKFMEIPNLPTDNLYKFIALTGAIIVVLSYYIPTTNGYETIDKMFKVYEDLGVIVIKQKHHKFELDQTEKEIDFINNELKEIRKIKGFTKTTRYNEIQENVKKLQNKIIKNTHILEIEVEKGVQKNNTIENLKERARHIIYLSMFTGFIGTIMACYGFVLWYFRVQKPLDSILQKKSQ